MAAHKRLHEKLLRNSTYGKLSGRPPIPMLLWCPECRTRHVDVGEFKDKPHHTHACQHCGHVWRPAVIATVGVQFLPGYLNRQSEQQSYPRRFNVVPPGTCVGFGVAFGKQVKCCPRAGEYNGFGSDGPLKFTCPNHCECHD
jgi:hypothetical protein